MIATTEITRPGTSDIGLAIDIRDLVVSYGSVRAVDRLSLVVPTGSVCGFLGPNGAGKTTTIKALLGFRRIDGGSARVLGYDVASENRRIRAHVGFVSEVNSLYDYLTIPQMADFYRATSQNWDQAILARYLKMFGLPAKTKIGHLSKGMKTQLAFALAISQNPALLIMDEPTAGLDPVARHDLLNQLVSEVAAAGKTVFFSSHNLAEVETVADRVGIINRGQLVVSDDLDHLKQTHQVLKVTFGDSPSPVELRALRDRPEVVSFEQEGRIVRLRLRGDANQFERTLSGLGLELRDTETIRLNLEDIFLGYMEDDKDVR